MQLNLSQGWLDKPEQLGQWEWGGVENNVLLSDDKNQAL